jgi:hypothetical protein
MSIVDPSKDFHLLEAFCGSPSEPISFFIGRLCERANGKGFTVHLQVLRKRACHSFIIPDWKKRKLMENHPPVARHSNHCGSLPTTDTCV